MTREEAERQVEWANREMLRLTAWEYDLRLLHQKAQTQLAAAEGELRLSREQLKQITG